MNISIDKSGNLFINKKSIKHQDLKYKVVDFVDKSMYLVVLNADKNISHDYVISVLDLLRIIYGLKLPVSNKLID